MSFNNFDRSFITSSSKSNNIAADIFYFFYHNFRYSIEIWKVVLHHNIDFSRLRYVSKVWDIEKSAKHASAIVLIVVTFQMNKVIRFMCTVPCVSWLNTNNGCVLAMLYWCAPATDEVKCQNNSAVWINDVCKECSSTHNWHATWYRHRKSAEGSDNTNEEGSV
jgi:hypothetical protein